MMTAQLSYWVLPVRDVDRATTFFSAVLDWEFSEPGSAGGRHVLGSEPWGGIRLRAGEAGESDRVLAFSPDDLDAAVARLRELGGTASEIEGAGDYGRWIECTDDQGTDFALFTPALEG
jgi:predicted enzyme related to lactoylglutathione lyase